MVLDHLRILVQPMACRDRFDRQILVGNAGGQAPTATPNQVVEGSELNRRVEAKGRGIDARSGARLHRAEVDLAEPKPLRFGAPAFSRPQRIREMVRAVHEEQRLPTDPDVAAVRER